MHCSTNVNQDIYTFQFIDLKAKHTTLNNINPSMFSDFYFVQQTAKLNPQLQHYFVEVKYSNTVIAFLYFQNMPFKGKELSTYKPQKTDCFFNKTVEKVVDIALDKINWNLLVLGNVFITGDQGQYWQSDISNDKKFEIIRKAANFIASNSKVDAFLLSDLKENELVDHESLIKKSYRLFEVEPDLLFNIDKNWNNFDDYLQSLVSKYRVRTKKVLKNSEQTRVKNLSLEEIEEHSATLYKLYKNVLNKSQFKLAEINENYFVGFKKAYPQSFFVRALYLENEIIGFISFFEDEKKLYLNFVGLNYNLNKEHCIYQKILYDCIEQGVLLKKEKIHFGRTASEIKTAVGAIPYKSYSLLKHSSTLPNLVIKALTNYLKPEPFEIRNPFGKK